jgi:aldehyde dehydrogenase
VQTYRHSIGGEWVEASDGQTFESLRPTSGTPWYRAARGTPEDVDRAVRAARAAFEDPAWAGLTQTQRGRLLRRLGDLVGEHAEQLAVAEASDNGKLIREMRGQLAGLPDYYHYFAGWADKLHGEVIPGTRRELLNYTLREPVGVVGAITPWNSPLLLTTMKLAPALAAGNTIVVKPSEHTSASLLEVMPLVEEAGFPKGVVNVVTGFGEPAGRALAEHPMVAKLAFTGSTATGRRVAAEAGRRRVRVTLELGGKSPNIFFADVFNEDDAFFDKALEGFTMFALNQGEVCTCPSRALVQESIYDAFMERAVQRVKKVVHGNPLDPTTMIGAQASSDQLEKILSYINIGQGEGARVLTGGKKASVGNGCEGGYYVEPTVFEGHNKMRIFQEEIFGPVLAVTKFKTEDEALTIANDTLYGLGAGVWSRDGNTAYRMGRGIKAGRVWTNCYHLYPAHAAFGGYKQSGVGRETHKMMLDHYQQTKNILVSYSPKALGFF